jgi:hypothetical protein
MVIWKLVSDSGTALPPANVDLLMQMPLTKYHTWQNWLQMKDHGHLKSAVGKTVICEVLLY